VTIEDQLTILISNTQQALQELVGNKCLISNLILEEEMAILIITKELKIKDFKEIS